VPEAEFRLKELMLLSLGGDAAAYRTLLSELSRHLRIYYRRRLGNDSADAEDLVQETLMALHTRRASFDRAQPFTAWAYAMARYKLVDHLRRRSVRAAVSVEDCEALFAPDEVEQAAATRDVDLLLSGLPESVREAIRLTRIEGYSVEEAAERTGKSTTATKVSIHRGLLRLAGKLGGGNDADR
jgi:RNA polymerase sigma-70 factor (ECF subfamily)